MIFGIGTDVLQAERVEKTWQRFGEHFARRLLLDEELALFAKAKRPVRFLAMRFAAKEAIVKALGTGFANGIWVRDVGMMPNALGQPRIVWIRHDQGDWSLFDLHHTHDVSMTFPALRYKAAMDRI